MGALGQWVVRVDDDMECDYSAPEGGLLPEPGFPERQGGAPRVFPSVSSQREILAFMISLSGRASAP